jgi:hypothetical protein
VLTVQQRKFSSIAKLYEQSKRFYGTVSAMPSYLFIYMLTLSEVIFYLQFTVLRNLTFF